MKQNETKKVPKSSDIFTCHNCDYNTSRKSQYDRHLLTAKHKNSLFETEMKQESSEKFQCLCGIIFTSRTTLWRHKKICTFEENKPENLKITDDNLILILINQCKELRDENKELIEVIKNGTNNNYSHNNTTNTNSLNKTFNLHFFLNETCKDAMNIMDFVDSIKLELSDLENVGRIGYVEGISNIITKNLKALDVTQRPIHCADKKREVVYVRDENKWEKEDEEKKTLRKAIKRVASKNFRLLPKFKEIHPDYGKSSSKISDQYNKIIIESCGGSGDNDLEKEDKIIHKITTVTTINKE